MLGDFQAPVSASNAANAPTATNPPSHDRVEGEGSATANHNAAKPTGLVEITSLPTEPEPTTNAAQPAARTVIVESKVGQINGRPVLASEILEPLDGRLRALTVQQKDPNLWRRDAFTVIKARLTSRVVDELVLAEAQSNLTSEQRQGLFYFLGKLQENLISAQGGSAVQADEALQSTTGRTLQAEAQDRLDRELIGLEMQTKVMPRVVVPWRQVRQEYDRRTAQYNPAPIARMSMIWVKAGDTAAQERVTAALKAELFETVAKSPDNQFLRDKAGAVSTEIGESFEKTQFFAIAEHDAAAHRLAPGQVSDPITTKDHVAWIRYDALDQRPSIALYDAQLEIESSLRERRFVAESDRYYSRLFERGTYTDIERMANLLLEIATQRYLSKGVAAK